MRDSIESRDRIVYVSQVALDRRKLIIFYFSRTVETTPGLLPIISDSPLSDSSYFVRLTVAVILLCIIFWYTWQQLQNKFRFRSNESDGIVPGETGTNTDRNPIQTPKNRRSELTPSIGTCTGTVVLTVRNTANKAFWLIPYTGSLSHMKGEVWKQLAPITSN